MMAEEMNVENKECLESASLIKTEDMAEEFKVKIEEGVVTELVPSFDVKDNVKIEQDSNSETIVFSDTRDITDECKIKIEEGVLHELVPSFNEVLEGDKLKLSMQSEDMYPFYNTVEAKKETGSSSLCHNYCTDSNTLSTVDVVENTRYRVDIPVSECDRVICDNSNLEVAVPSGSEIPTCRVCNKANVPNTRNSHIKDTCDVCLNMLSHNSKGHSNENTPAIKIYFCNTCPRTFMLKSSLDQHMLTHKTFICDICNRIFKMKRGLIVHLFGLQGITNYSCDICSKTFTDKCQLKRHTATHTEVDNYCGICGKAFKYKCTLKIHTRIHTGVEYYSCNVCSKTFTDKCQLKKHTVTHTKVNYNCSICNKKFTDKSRFKRHTIAHTKRNYYCGICGKAFMCKNYFKKHTRSHTGVENYSCNICNKRFTQESSFNIHKLNHSRMLNMLSHNSNENTPTIKIYSCYICPRTFMFQSSLDKHLLTHRC